jgi:citrate lyase subunit beta/citryl-CoA lyase
MRVAVIETALGVQAVDDIARGPYVRGLSVGPADLGADLGVRAISRSPWDWPQDMVYAKQRVIVAARAARIGIVDGGWRAVDDTDGLRTRAAASAQMGFDGMLAFDETQVPIITREFSPSDREVAWAQRVLAVVAELDEAGEVPLRVDGEVIETPQVQVAETIMARAAP